MHPFSLQTPAHLEAAILNAQQDEGARFIAGGTNLLDLMKLTIERPSSLLDITGLPGLDGIGRDADGNLRVGALAKMSDVADHPLVNDSWPVIAHALNKGASAQLRNMATIGGNLLQRTRCSYFRDIATRCNKRNPGEGCDAIGGINREHALLGVSDHCIALNPSDLCVALAALDTKIEISGPGGYRTVPFEELYQTPGDTPHIEHTLSRDEIVTAVIVEPSAAARHSTYLKIRDRESYQFAVVSVAAAIEAAGDGTIVEARIGLGGVATVPWRARNVEIFLRGRRINDETATEAGRIAMAGSAPRAFNKFKIALMEGVLSDALVSLKSSKGNR